MWAIGQKWKRSFQSERNYKILIADTLQVIDKAT